MLLVGRETASCGACFALPGGHASVVHSMRIPLSNLNMVILRIVCANLDAGSLAAGRRAYRLGREWFGTEDVNRPVYSGCDEGAAVANQPRFAVSGGKSSVVRIPGGAAHRYATALTARLAAYRGEMALIPFGSTG